MFDSNETCSRWLYSCFKIPALCQQNWDSPINTSSYEGMKRVSKPIEQQTSHESFAVGNVTSTLNRASMFFKFFPNLFLWNCFNHLFIYFKVQNWSICNPFEVVSVFGILYKMLEDYHSIVSDLWGIVTQSFEIIFRFLGDLGDRLGILSVSRLFLWID